MADVTITGLSPATSISSTDVVPVSNGSATYKATLSQILTQSTNSYNIEYLIIGGCGGGGSE